MVFKQQQRIGPWETAFCGYSFMPPCVLPLAGQAISIESVGGSITVGHGAVDGKSWVTRLHEWTNATFPNLTVQPPCRRYTLPQFVFFLPYCPRLLRTHTETDARHSAGLLWG